MKSIPYSRQSISEKDIQEVVKVLRSDLITQGDKIKEFENNLAKFVNVKYAVVFSSGTSALHAAYFAVGLKTGDEIITSPLTFAATSNAALYLGAKPIFSDIDKKTGNIDVSLIEEKITKHTRLIAPIHYAGFPATMKSISKIAKKHNLKVVDDASHAIGAKIGTNLIGNGKFSDITVFSFHAVKHITTGEGGAATTNDKNLYKRMLMFQTHGITKDKKLFVNKSSGDWYHEMQFLGFNYRLTDFQAALGISQLKRVNQFITKRQSIAKTYDLEFKNNSYFDILNYPKDTKSIYHLYPILLNDKYKKHKREIFENLKKQGLGVQTHYIPTYLHPYYKNLGYKKGTCPLAEDFYEREISIPLNQSMSKADVSYVVKSLNNVFKHLP